jgi:hypothetical protein
LNQYAAIAGFQRMLDAGNGLGSAMKSEPWHWFRAIRKWSRMAEPGVG